MHTSHSTTFTTERAEYDAKSAAGETVLLAPALHLPHTVKDIADYYRTIATQAERVGILNTIVALRELRRLRREYATRNQEAQATLKDTVERLGEPVEGSSALEMGWVQGFTLAAGLSAYTNLQSAVTAAGEAIDRKSAYAIACFSLYVAAISLSATLVLGIMSLKTPNPSIERDVQGLSPSAAPHVKRCTECHHNEKTGLH